MNISSVSDLGFIAQLDPSLMVLNMKAFFLFVRVLEVFGRFYTDPDQDFLNRIRIFGQSRSGLRKKAVY